MFTKDDLIIQVPCSPRPQFAVIPPAPAGEEGAVHHVVAALGHLLGREQKNRQSPTDRRRDCLDGPREQWAGTHSTAPRSPPAQYYGACTSQPPAATRTDPGTGGQHLNPLLAQPDEQLIEFIPARPAVPRPRAPALPGPLSS